MSWALAEAKQKFSEVIDCAVQRGPQFITRRGTETAVVLSVDQYRSLTQDHKASLKDYILHGPSLEGLDTGRDKSVPQVVDL